MCHTTYDAKRRLLEIVCLNCTLNGVTLVATMRKPFDVLAEGLVSENSRGDKTAIELFIAGVRTWEPGLRRQLDVEECPDHQGSTHILGNSLESKSQPRF
jgi:hypothetical protein